MAWLERVRSINILNAAVLATGADGKTSLMESVDPDARPGPLFGVIAGGLMGPRR